MITSGIRCREGGEECVSNRDVRQKKGEKIKKKKHNTRQSDTTIISIAGERGAVRER